MKILIKNRSNHGDPRVFWPIFFAKKIIQQNVRRWVPGYPGGNTRVNQSINYGQNIICAKNLFMTCDK